MSQPFWFDDGRTVEERSMQGVEEIDAASRCDACLAGNHVRCINRGIEAIDGKLCPCYTCLQIDRDAENDRIDGE